MQRWFAAGCAGLLFAVAVSTSRAAGGAPGETPLAEKSSSPVSVQIHRLSDPDPWNRLDATQRLINMGVTARPALRAAITTADPQTRSLIDQVLLHVPWTRPGDSEAVSQAFAGYADRDAESRCAQIDNSLAPLGNTADTRANAAEALLRIVLDDPSPAVRWKAADDLRPMLAYELDESFQQGDALTRQVVRCSESNQEPRETYLPADENAPLLALAGWALRQSNPNRAAELFSTAIAIESERPSAFAGQADFAFQWLSDRVALRKEYTRMAQLLRQQAMRTPWNPDAIPDSVARLFAAQADHGPLPGLADDLRCYRDYLGHPEMVYALGRMLEQHGYRYAAKAVNDIALLMGGMSTDAHYATGTFLGEQGWDAVAQRELLWSISLSNGKEFSAYFALHWLAEQRDDDLASAQYLEQYVKQVHDSGQELQPRGVLDQFAAEVEWHYLRAFRLANDRSNMQKHLEKLMVMDQDQQVLQKDPGMAADIVPALEELGRREQADRIFDTAYRALLDKVTATPADPMPKNNLAWLCACSGRKLDEAVKYSDQAVALDPEDSACLDTQAEAYFRTGRAREALEIESRALQFKPDDLYMARQVERFRAAAGKK